MKPVTARGIPGNKQGEQMNSKMIAVLAVAIMAVSGCVVTMSAQSDADAVDLGMVYVDENPAEVELRFNEYAYSLYDSYYLVLQAQVGSNTAAIVFEASEPTDSASKTADVPVSNTTDLDLTVTKDSMGVYTVQVKNDTNKTAASGEYTISFTLYVNATIEGTAIPLTPIGFNLNVNVRSFIDSTSPSVSGSMIAGASGSVEVSANIDGGKKVTEFTSWYATGLPDGLNVGIIEDKLMIYGMTAASDNDTTYTVDLIGRDAVGNEVKIADVSLKITKTPKITYEIANVEKIAGVADAYMVESGKTPAPKLTIKVDGVEYSSGTSGSQLIVSVISDEGERTDKKYTSGGIDIPTNGVGKYVIEMTIGGSSEEGSVANGVSTNATLHVVPNITGAGAGFIVVGQP